LKIFLLYFKLYNIEIEEPKDQESHDSYINENFYLEGIDKFNKNVFGMEGFLKNN
jgi:hypothetical protein